MRLLRKTLLLAVTISVGLAARANDRSGEPEAHGRAATTLQSELKTVGSAQKRGMPTAVYNQTVVRYRTKNDYPTNFFGGATGNPIPVPAGGYVQRDDYAIAIVTGAVTFSPGCIPVSADPGAPCMTDANGTVMRKREWYTFRLSYLNPTDPAAPELTSG